MSAPTDPQSADEAWLVALSFLPQMGPRRFEALLRDGDARGTWERIGRGDLLDDPALVETLAPHAEAIASRWRRAANGIDPHALLGAHHAAGIAVVSRSDPACPAALADDLEPPQVLFHLGDLDSLAGPRTAVVGTRRCSRYGFDVAFELGRDLAAAGVRVVSGLALGIDAAAHAGALEARGAPPVAVVGSGLDVVYPRHNAALWRRIAQAGTVLSEYPLGAEPKAWRFPARNRLIAALADVVVVVESGRRGGSMYTVDEADRRGRTIVAVPGPVTSPTSEGTNTLLADRAVPYLGVQTVLNEFALDTPARTRGREARPAPSKVDRQLLDAMGWEPTTLEHLALRSGLSPRDLVEALDRLDQDGWIAQRAGWWERIGR
jgi:DNA processing protein